MNLRREPSSSPQEGLHLRSPERPEFVHEADPREGLRVTCGSLLEPGHADEHHAETALVEHRTELFEARHGGPVGFINDDEQSGMRNRSFLRFILFEGLEVCGGERCRLSGKAEGVIEVFACVHVQFTFDLLDRALSVCFEGIGICSNSSTAESRISQTAITQRSP
jgi:hypothetical protein